MPSPFPGMDPYLEDPVIWTGVESSLLTVFQEALVRAVRPKYAVAFRETSYRTAEDDPGYHVLAPPPHFRPETKSVWLSDSTITPPIPVIHLVDSEIPERWLEIVKREDKSVAAAIKLLDPATKVAGSFRRENLLRFRRSTFESEAHWVEMDLLRGGTRTPNLPGVPASDYLAYLSRLTERGRRGYAWPISVRDRLPVIAIPIGPGDPDVALDLQAAFDLMFDRGGYDLDSHYDIDPIPALGAEDAAWAEERIANWRSYNP